ncbi:uncharacterized protein LOC124284737 [Haliotis rubra]|uniref:uncharacterized protein LOC124284737 n=1 Tax=Haliotis rubra TaxID=36100 RepID=UPI001EE606D2|nr:uncharacterized protein LOC124284737 [Haliotis rubra]
MAEMSSPSQTWKPQKRVCTVCKEYVKDKMYRSLVSEPSEPYRKYITEIGIPATGLVCYPCVSKLNRLVKIDRDLSTLLDRLKEKRVHLMCELKMLSTGMDHVDASFTSSILGMTPLDLALPPNPKKMKVDKEISTAHFSRILPKKQPVLVIQNPVPKLPETVSLGKAPVILQTVPVVDPGSVPSTGITKTQQAAHPVIGLVSLQGKSKTRPVVPRPIQPAKQGVDLVSRTGKPTAHQPLQPITSVKKELPKILPRPLQVHCELGSTVSGSGKNGAALPVVSNVVVQTRMPVSLDMSAVPNGVIVQPGIQGPEIQGPKTQDPERGTSVTGPLSTDDKSIQTSFPLNNELENLNYEYLNSSQQCQTQEEVCLKNGFERIVTESGDEYSIVKQEFSDSESCDTDEPGSEVEESSGGTDGDESLSQSCVIKQEPQEEFQTSVEHVSKNCLASHQEHMKDCSDTGDSGMSVSQSVVIKQEQLSFDTPDNHVKQTSDTGDSGMSVSQSVVIKQEQLSFDTPDNHVKQTSDTGDSGMSVSQSVVIKQEQLSFDTPDNHVKQTSDTGDSGMSVSQSVVIKQEQLSFDTPDNHVKQTSDTELIVTSDTGESCMSESQSIVIKEERLSAFDSPKERLYEGGAYFNNHVKQTSDSGESGMSEFQSVVIKQELHSAFHTPEEHVGECGVYSDNHVKQTSDAGESCLSVSRSVLIKQQRYSAFYTPEEHVPEVERIVITM